MKYFALLAVAAAQDPFAMDPAAGPAGPGLAPVKKKCEAYDYVEYPDACVKGGNIKVLYEVPVQECLSLCDTSEACLAVDVEPSEEGGSKIARCVTKNSKGYEINREYAKCTGWSYYEKLGCKAVDKSAVRSIALSGAAAVAFAGTMLY